MMQCLNSTNPDGFGNDSDVDLAEIVLPNGTVATLFQYGKRRQALCDLIQYYRCCAFPFCIQRVDNSYSDVSCRLGGPGHIWFRESGYRPRPAVPHIGLVLRITAAQFECLGLSHSAEVPGLVL